jgi:hypothetical protein
MSISTLKEELLRELAVAALAEPPAGFLPIGGSTDLIDWQSGPTSPLRREALFRLRGPALVVAHIHDGSRIWLAAGTFPQTGTVSIVAADVVHWTDDTAGVSRLCVRRDPSRSPPLRFETEQMPLFPAPTHVAAFCSNVLNGHVQDA